MIRCVKLVKKSGERISVSTVAAHYGYDRTYYYKYVKQRAKEELESDAALRLVHRERHLQPRLSAKKVHRLIKDELAQEGVKMGRDKLLSLLREKGLLLEKRKSFTVTTDSKHEFKRYGNLLIDRVISAPNQVYVADITYVSTLEGFMYLCLVMDAYSRKIVGWCLHDTLEMEGCISALKMALSKLTKAQCKRLIHHSDHGVQYCCNAYRKLLRDHEVRISMSGVGNCYDNAQAERLNGIMKQEYGLGDMLRSKATARELCASGIELYNTRRPHLSLSNCFPEAVHSGAIQPNVRMGWAKKKQADKAA